MTDIFISYARSDEHSDRIVAATIRDRLKSMGLKVYMDTDLQPGDDYEKTLQNEITDSQVLLALYSSHSLTRNYFLSECDFALKLKKIMPVLLEQSAADHIPLSLRKINYQVFDAQSQESWSRLIDSLSLKLNISDLAKRFELSVRPLLASSTNAHSMNVQVVLSDMQKGRITIPDYQRDGGEWSAETKSLFIESIINNLAIPALFFEPTVTADNRTINEVVDGQQRLATLDEFYKSDFCLLESHETSYMSPNSMYYAGKRFRDLPPTFQDTFEGYKLPIINLVDVGHMRLEIFRRINRGGTPLSAHDIRLAYYSDRSPTVTFIKLVGIYDESRSSSANFLSSARAKFGIENPWTDSESRELWKNWWDGRDITRGQTPSVMFLHALMAAQYTKIGEIVRHEQILAALNIFDKRSLEDIRNIYCARTQFEDKQPTLSRLLFDIDKLQSSFFPSFQYGFTRIQRSPKKLPSGDYQLLATILGVIYGMGRDLRDLTPTQWARVFDFIYAPKDVARGVQVVWRTVDGNWSGAGGWRGRMQTVTTVFERLLS